MNTHDVVDSGGTDVELDGGHGRDYLICTGRS